MTKLTGPQTIASAKALPGYPFFSAFLFLHYQLQINPGPCLTLRNNKVFLKKNMFSQSSVHLINFMLSHDQLIFESSPPCSYDFPIPLSQYNALKWKRILFTGSYLYKKGFIVKFPTWREDPPPLPPAGGHNVLAMPGHPHHRLVGRLAVLLGHLAPGGSKTCLEKGHQRLPIQFPL